MVEFGAGNRMRLAIVGVVALATVVGLSACSPPAPAAPTGANTETPGASAAPTAPPAPKFDPAGDAAANLDYFDAVNRALVAATPKPSGREIVDNLVGAGFAKTDIEVTPDVTIGKEAAEAIQFSVRIGGSCLVGQTGAAGYNAIAAPLLGTGKCLVGTTRPIDW
ncbi:MAG: hypothetical protein JWM50_811 [Microbacteriaceae bacterium]|jgi:hypothetical protein|nr:hypothetical protein [Microbacteriaceae bacterium]